MYPLYNKDLKWITLQAERKFIKFYFDSLVAHSKQMNMQIRLRGMQIRHILCYMIQLDGLPVRFK